MDWSWNTVHLSEEAHRDREHLEEFLNWLNLQVCELGKEDHPNKSHLQQLLLGIAFALRDLEFVYFTDHQETPIPQFLVESCMVAEDSLQVSAALEIIFRLVDNHIK